MSDHIGYLRQLASLCSVPMPIIPNDVEQRLRDAADEIERLGQLAIDRAGKIIDLDNAMALQRDEDGDEIARLTASTTRRIDRAGRDVTDLPGLWNESDRIMTAVELGEEVGRLTAEVEQRTDVARELQRLLWIASPVDGTWTVKCWPWLAKETT